MELGVTVGDSLDRLEGVADAFDFVEFGLSEAADVPAAIDDDRLAAALAVGDFDLVVHLPFEQDVATPIPEINDAIVAYQERLLDWAAGVGARKAVLHAVVRDPHDTGERATIARQLQRIVDAGAERGVEVVVENVGHQRNGLQLSVLGDLAEEIDAPVCFDVGHAYMEAGDEGVERFLKYHGERVSHLHVHDVRGRGDTHMPLGAGEIDYGIVGEHCAGFDGTAAVEVFSDDAALLADTAERITGHLDDPDD
ncbi:sugar phosphate isomerase/epimerase (plasmid) [Halarchaeum sp. CBA1220]|uniref:sugar phosphate isomerase/epimerase family protein n=1 Tax=Halarchaeum sp. CBA1220 TaxID=1853682 RepID=UPI000F3A8975|nr:sugar phosphate isomerase/epimerase [Halarchaeum sp. CBA1220]QLC35135.1 sugar phosphate isomerase/epimerase [Halarchaeum sp. CBA1220]